MISRSSQEAPGPACLQYVVRLLKATRGQSSGLTDSLELAHISLLMLVPSMIMFVRMEP